MASWEFPNTAVPANPIDPANPVDPRISRDPRAGGNAQKMAVMLD